MKKTKILIVGAAGQLGYELTSALRLAYGHDNVIASDIKPPYGILKEGPFEQIDVLQKNQIFEVIQSHRITQVYHLAALLSANGEKNPQYTWKLNMESLLSILEIAAEQQLDKVYWPSSIAVFGSNTPKENTPQQTIKDPSTVYGITKLAGEQWCEYYFKKYALDVRSLRYPGLIGYKMLPGGGVTDYAIDIYFSAVREHSFSCFIDPDTHLPMMYMDDAIRATLDLMEAPLENISVRSSYNISSMSVCPAQMASAIKHHIPDFTITYKPDARQTIAASWPHSVDDSIARNDWSWKPQFNLEQMTSKMLKNIKAGEILSKA